MTITLQDILIAIAIVSCLYAAWRIFNYRLFPWIVEKLTTDIEKNPKWITTYLQKNYYGFSDLDFIIVNSPLGMTPRFRASKTNRNNLELLISEDITTNDVESIGRFALVGKIKMKYGLWYPDKPLYWLSILCYMLDGKDIQQDAVSWKDVKRDNKSVDLSE